jgi:hypothetical protein
MRSVLGEDELGLLATSLFQSALTSGTYVHYSSNLTGFFKFCSEHALEPLATTPVDIARYIAWLGLRGTVSATSLTPYLSAINRFLQDHALPPVALGPLVAGVRKGLMNCQTDTAPLPERLPLPAPVALAILELGEKLLPETDWDPEDPTLPVLRAAVATIASYVFFNRGECSACALAGDLVVGSTHITLLLRQEKGRKGLNAGYRNVRQIATYEAPRIAALLRAFFKGQAAMSHPRGQLARRWSISPREDVEVWSALTLTDWLRAAFTAAGHLPPEGFSWTSHSLRKGAASAANAIGARLTDIRYQGGWATNSNVLEAKYIDFTMQPSEAARLFFGYLCKGTIN